MGAAKNFEGTERLRDAIAADPKRAYEAVIGRQLVERIGVREPVTICPFHDDRHPSFRVNLSKGTWYCDVCGKGGDLFDLAAQLWGSDFPRTRQRLAELLGVNLSNGDGSSCLGGSSKQQVGDPIRWEIRTFDGKIATHVRIDFDDGSKRMWWEPKGVKPRALPLYRSHRAAEWPASATALLVEGEPCADRLAQLGVNAVGTVCGAAAVPCDDALKPLLRLAGVILWRDNDDPGVRHMQRIGARLLELGLPRERVHWIDVARVKGLEKDGADAADLDDDQVRDALENAVVPFPADEPARPTVVIEGGDGPQIVDIMQKALAEHHRRTGIYDQNGRLVRLAAYARNEDRAKPLIQRAEGAPILRPLTSAAVRDLATRLIDFQKPDRRARKNVPMDCPASLADWLIDRGGDGFLPLRGIIGAPLLRSDGSILSTPGYDEATGLLLVTDLACPAVADNPSKDDAIAAGKLLLEPFEEVPFITDEDRAVIGSAILTGIQRRQLVRAPSHGFDAPQQSSGKTLVADCAALIATGFPATTITVGYDRAELEKRLISTLLAGDAAILIDNVEESLDCDFLASMLTRSTIDARVMGGNATAKLPTNTLMTFTGNNLSFSGDMPSRVISGRINPACEHPEERKFKIPDLRAHVLEHRAELVTAALTILRAHCLAGRPQEGLTPFGRFEQWNAEIRAALVWAALGDPCKTRERIASADPERDATGAVLTAWRAQFADAPVAIRAVIKAAESDEPLRFALLEVAADSKDADRVNSVSLGRWCGLHVDRIVGDHRLNKVAAAKGVVGQWFVEKLDETGRP